MKQCSILILSLFLLGSCQKEKDSKTPVAKPASAPTSVAFVEPPKVEPALVEPSSEPVVATSPMVATVPDDPPDEPTSGPVVQPSVSPPVADPVVAPKPKPLDVYDGLLKAYVSGGKVDYSGFEKERVGLDEFLSFVAKASSTQKLAFWINAYNATVIAALLDNGLPKQVLDVKGFFDSKKYKFAGQSMTLNELEDKIRKDFKDPRIHFALNCGAKSCPPLLAKAYRESTLDKTLTDLTSKFLNGSGVKIDDTKKEIQVTKLMDWYGTDFKEKEGSVEAYLKKWVTDTTKKAAIDTGSYKVTFQFYDWSINKK